MSSRQLIRYIVLSVEAVLVEQKASARMKRLVLKGNKGQRSGESDRVEKSRAVAALAECVLVRERDFGVNDVQFTCTTHLGGLLSEGDTVLGYDLTDVNFNVDDADTEMLESMSLPDVILVRKCYERRGERAWKLKKLEADKGDEKESGRRAGGKDDDYDADMEDFMQQVEGDREMRQGMNIYRKSAAELQQRKKGAASRLATVEEGEDAMDEEDAKEKVYDSEELRLEELLDEMVLNSDLDAEDEAEEMQQKNARHIAEFRILSEEEAAAALPIFDLAAETNGLNSLKEGEDEDI